MHRSRHDARPHRQRRGRRHQVRRRRPVPLRSARQHRYQRRRSQSGSPTRSARASSSARSSRRFGRRPAAARRWASDEERKKFVDAGPKRLPHRARSCATSAFAPTASCASTPPAASTIGAKTRRQHAADRRDVPGSRATSPTITANASPPKAKSAGAACTAGSRWSSCWNRSDRPETVGFQADMAHTLLYTLGYNAPEHRIAAGGFRLGTREARQRPEEAHRRRFAPGRSTFTSPRTTPPSKAPARTTRPGAIACRTIRTAN